MIRLKRVGELKQSVLYAPSVYADVLMVFRKCIHRINQFKIKKLITIVYLLI